MRSGFPLAVVSGCLIAGPALCGVAVEMIRTDAATGKQSPADRFYVQQTMLKIEPGDTEENFGVIFRDDSLYLIDHDDKSYQHITGEAIRNMAAQLSPMLEQMRAQLANLPPEQRQMVEKMMQERMGVGSLERPAIEMQPTSRDNEVDGRDCRVWEMSVNGKRTHELCIAPPDSIDGGEELVAALRAMAQFQQGILDSLGMQAGAENPFMNMTELDGVPVESVTYEQDRIVERVRLSGAEERSFSDADFLPPEGYRLIENDL